MALRKIYKEGEAILKKKAKPVTKYDSRLALLIDDMKETVKDANGLGLAAPQVGILKRVVVIDAGGETGIIELINPEITEHSGEQVYYEGCLSYPGYYGNVGRPETLTVRAYDRHGKSVGYRAGGLYAVACCHESDHLEGLMFMRQVKGRLYTLEEVRKIREESEAQAAAQEPSQTTAQTTAQAGVQAGMQATAQTGGAGAVGMKDAAPGAEDAGNAGASAGPDGKSGPGTGGVNREGYIIRIL
jgi:peptide deformylase